jgi:hypothetical protein
VELYLHFPICLHGLYRGDYLYSFLSARENLPVKTNTQLLLLLLCRAGPHNLQITLPTTQSYAALGYIWREWTFSKHPVRSRRDKTAELLLKLRSSLFTVTYITLLIHCVKISLRCALYFLIFLQDVQKRLYKRAKLDVCILNRFSFCVLNLEVSACRPNFTAVARAITMGWASLLCTSKLDTLDSK